MVLNQKKRKIVRATGMKNHKKLGGKLIRTDKQFRHLKQEQKDKISTWLYEEYRSPKAATGHEPQSGHNDEIARAVMERIENAEIWIPEQEVRTYFTAGKVATGTG